MSHCTIFAGNGRGKTPAAVGEALLRASAGESVVIIQFLKGKGLEQEELLKRLEPEIKIFHFEKAEENYSELSKGEQQDELINIKNGLNFARKVLSTGSCDLLVLDEILGIVDNGILKADELKEMLEMRPESMDVIMTGINLSDEVKALSNEVYKIIPD